MRPAPPVMDDDGRVVDHTLVAQGPIERRRRARAQQGQLSPPRILALRRVGTRRRGASRRPSDRGDVLDADDARGLALDASQANEIQIDRLKNPCRVIMSRAYREGLVSCMDGWKKQR